jgi:hypothetical protein
MRPTIPFLSIAFFIQKGAAQQNIAITNRRIKERKCGNKKIAQ